MPEMRGHHSGSVWGAHHQKSDEVEGDDAYNAPSMTSAWFSSLHDLPAQQETHVEGTQPRGGGGKKKKKKEKQLLFSTSMARKV
ncbi:hypothetical protein ElyMa_002571200 [Elysia marginata]|uniref:Uncharacterized protein n=1 Tax=Elysia marginata TaxID=1093978 RepID=A0AAV4H1Y8_9GAST|nr:hypothetical protein ElyMa_002571200 [Elysia marginata]